MIVIDCDSIVLLLFYTAIKMFLYLLGRTACNHLASSGVLVRCAVAMNMRGGGITHLCKQGYEITECN